LHFDGEPAKAPRVPGESGPVQSELLAVCFQVVQVETQACWGLVGHGWQSIEIVPPSVNVPVPIFVISPHWSLSRFAKGQDEGGSPMQQVFESGTVLILHKPVSALPPSSAM